MSNRTEWLNNTKAWLKSDIHLCIDRLRSPRIYVSIIDWTSLFHTVVQLKYNTVNLIIHLACVMILQCPRNKPVEVNGKALLSGRLAGVHLVIDVNFSFYAILEFMIESTSLVYINTLFKVLIKKCVFQYHLFIVYSLRQQGRDTIVLVTLWLTKVSLECHIMYARCGIKFPIFLTSI